jgi:hypothetical protein
MKEFEKDYLTQLEARFPDTLLALRKGLTEDVEKTLTSIAAEVSLKFN